MSWNVIEYLKKLDLYDLYRLRNDCHPDGVCHVTAGDVEHVIPLNLIRVEMRARFEPSQQVAAEAKDPSWDPVAYLKGVNTRALLELRNDCHKFHGYCDVLDNHSHCVVTTQQVLDELNTREHIPCKQEAKLLRRLMSQNKMTEKQVRAIPKFATMLAQAQYRRVVSAEMCNLYKQHVPSLWVTKKMLVLPAAA
jgi:hypothetical protein